MSRKLFPDYQQTDPSKLDVLRVAAGRPEDMFKQSMEKSALVSSLDLSDLGRSDIEEYTQTLRLTPPFMYDLIWIE